jgi:hypothetical protein
MQEKPGTAINRRNFLGAVGGASAATVTAAAATLAPTQAEAYDPGAEEMRARYQADAPDVQAFYRTNGYETLKK